jgi:hypothetical protein
MTQLDSQSDLQPDRAATDEAAAGAPTLEDRFAAFGEAGGATGIDNEPSDENGRPDNGAEGDRPDERTADEAAGDVAGDVPASPVTPPVSWTPAEKEEFARLPRAVQETLSRREAERERFVQAKSQEARGARAEVEREALATFQQLQSRYAEHLAHFEAQLEVPEPDPQLIAEDPALYAAQLQQHRYYAAQRLEAQQLLAQARHQAAFAEKEIAAREQQATRAALADAFPEYLDAQSGPKLRQELGSTALELGYSAEQLAQVDHVDILAMRKANEWRSDALKYRALMASRMETVRAARDMPRVSRPGSGGRGAAESQRNAQDRQKMRDGDKDAAVRTFARFLDMGHAAGVPVIPVYDAGPDAAELMAEHAAVYGCERVLIGTSRKGPLYHLIKGGFQQHLETLLPPDVAVEVISPDAAEDAPAPAPGGPLPEPLRPLTEVSP